MQESYINKFIKIVGNKNIITRKKDMEKYLKEWRGVYNGAAGAIVKPKSTKEISKILKFSYKKKYFMYSAGWKHRSCWWSNTF